MFFCVLCFSFLRVCSLPPCGSADLLALVGDVYCIFVTFTCGILGQVWYLIVLFTDLCCISYFDRVIYIGSKLCVVCIQEWYLSITLC